MKKPLRLYWCETDDHHEDWFVVARSPRRARTAFADFEGYDTVDVHAELICDVPSGTDFGGGDPEGPAGESVLLLCGGVIVRDEMPRVVRLGGRTFAEGMLEALIRELDDDSFEAEGRGRPNKTTRAPSG